MTYCRYRAEQRKEAAELQRVEDWIAKWDNEVVVRRERKYEECQRAMSKPTTPGEISLKADILKRVKRHLKVVLRRADALQIPMEIPEATSIATKEMIDAVVDEEDALVKADMRAAATAYEEVPRNALLFTNLYFINTARI